MTTDKGTPTEANEDLRSEYRLQFARAWMQRKRDEQEHSFEEFQNDPVLVAAHEELKRQNTERGSCIVEV